MDRYDTLYRSISPLVVDGSPVVVDAIKMLYDNDTGNLVMQCRFVNIDSRDIKNLAFKATLYDISGKPLGDVLKNYSSERGFLPGSKFGEFDPIISVHANAASVQIKTIKATFADGKTWDSGLAKWVSANEIDINTISNDHIEPVNTSSPGVNAIRVTSQNENTGTTYGVAAMDLVDYDKEKEDQKKVLKIAGVIALIVLLIAGIVIGVNSFMKGNDNNVPVTDSQQQNNSDQNQNHNNSDQNEYYDKYKYYLAVEEMNVRSGPSTASSIVGVTYANSAFKVDYQTSDGRYTWNHIGSGYYVANDGTFLVEISYQEYMTYNGILWK